AFNNIGMTYFDVGRLDSARVYLERAQAIQRANPIFTGEAATLGNLGSLRTRTVVDDSAFALLRRSLALSLGAQDKLGEGTVRLQLARAFHSAGRPDSALASAREALALMRAVRDRPQEGLALAEIGRALASTGKIDSARVYFSQAIDVMRAAGFTRGVRATLGDMAELFRAAPGATDLARATAYYDSAAAVVDDARRGAGGDDNEVALSESQVDVFGGWARAWVGRSGEAGVARSAASALGAVERGRAQSLMDMVTRLQSTNRAQTLARLRSTPGQDLAGEVDTLLAPLRATGTAALTYLMAGDTLFTWFLAPSGELELQPPVAITDADLNRLVRSSRRAFQADDARSVQLDPDELTVAVDSLVARRNPADDWKRLAELLLPAELTAKVPPGTPIVIVPHGAIGLVPFAALAPGGGRDKSGRDSTIRERATSATASTRRVARDTASVPLGARNPLRYAPSFAALRASGQAARTVATGTVSSSETPTPARRRTSSLLAGALVVGNPTMPFVYSGRMTNRAQLKSLPGAEAESRTIATLLGARPLTGKAATETAVRARMGAAPLIHFATHGLAYGTSAAARRSYVAFAADSAQDGLLTLGELMDDRALTLRAELVVLSACQSGLGDMKKAEGTIGLQRAFLAKGARSVLVSLWNVDDRATRLLMEKFYAYWLDPKQSRTKATALQLAQDAVRRTPGFADPKFWAAFQLVGAD
ncbi:MAG: CHAT domain-containing tetratricopeptide repeat protein, partial [Gemmatimonas sp.]